MTERFYNRYCEIIVGDRRVAFEGGKGLRASFRIERSLEPGPSPGEIVIYNLGKDARSEIQQGGPVQVSAGYQDIMPLLFVGTPDRIWSESRGPDIVTRITVGDGLASWRQERVRKSFAPGIKPEQIIKDLLRGSGIAAGRALETIKEKGIRAGVQEFARGVTLDGPLGAGLQEILDGVGLEGSIQGGELQVLLPGEVTTDEAILLTPTTGLIGSPEIGLEGEVKIESLLNGEIYPGRAVVVSSRHTSGLHRARKVVHDGDTHARPWYTTIIGEPIIVDSSIGFEVGAP